MMWHDLLSVAAENPDTEHLKPKEKKTDNHILMVMMVTKTLHSWMMIWENNNDYNEDNEDNDDNDDDDDDDYND